MPGFVSWPFHGPYCMAHGASCFSFKSHMSLEKGTLTIDTASDSKLLEWQPYLPRWQHWAGITTLLSTLECWLLPLGRKSTVWALSVTHTRCLSSDLLKLVHWIQNSVKFSLFISKANSYKEENFKGLLKLHFFLFFFCFFFLHKQFIVDLKSKRRWMSVNNTWSWPDFGFGCGIFFFLFSLLVGS